MGRLVFFVIIIVACLFAYDQYKISQMKQQVDVLSQRLHVKQVESVAKKATTKAVQAVEKNIVAAPLNEAKSHTLRAKQLLKKNKIKEAQKELDIAISKIDNANTASNDIVGEATDYLRKARKDALETLKKSWKDISEEPKETKPKEPKKQ
jgi:predicted negative regulator of RcsB-dependent stress response